MTRVLALARELSAAAGGPTAFAKKETSLIRKAAGAERRLSVDCDGRLGAEPALERPAVR